jgi:hypothetical protein
MSPHEVITECQRLREIKGACWPFPLIRYLDDPPSECRVFDWLCLCVGDLLHYFGRSTAAIEDAISSLRQHTAKGTGRDEIEQTAWHFWPHRSPNDPTFTAVAQLLFAFSRADQSPSNRKAWSCSTPIILLEDLESRQGEVFDRVLRHFSNYLDGHSA